MYGTSHWTEGKRLCLGIVTTYAKPMKMSGLPVLTNVIARYINVSWRPAVAWWRWYGLHMNTHMQSTCKYVKYMLNLGENMLAIVLYIVLLGEIWVTLGFTRDFEKYVCSNKKNSHAWNYKKSWGIFRFGGRFTGTSITFDFYFEFLTTPEYNQGITEI